MKNEKMNIRKRVKETLALALSLLMVLSVICVPIRTAAAPSIPVDTVFVEGEEISFTDTDFYLLEYSWPVPGTSPVGIAVIDPTDSHTSVSGDGFWYYQKPVYTFPHAVDETIPNSDSLISVFRLISWTDPTTVSGVTTYTAAFLAMSGIKVEFKKCFRTNGACVLRNI